MKEIIIEAIAIGVLFGWGICIGWYLRAAHYTKRDKKWK